MDNKEAISVLESIDAKTDYFLINDDARAEAIDMSIEALQNSAELISWLDECISDEHTAPIERATLMAVKCKAEEIAYGRNDN